MVSALRASGHRINLIWLGQDKKFLLSLEKRMRETKDRCGKRIKLEGQQQDFKT